MAILQEILAWTKELPAWQSDAVSRLLAKQVLTPEDHEDLYALLKQAHGIPDPKNRQPQPLSADQVPALVKRTTHIELHAIKNLRNVNAIAENQQLAVGPSGMTVIYGDNGSGKSGYSRVLKRACRARDQSEPIHPNANVPLAQAGTAQASFDLSIDGNLEEVLWQQGKEAPPELSSFSIFDAHCARAYLDNEDDFSYVPYGLDVFQALAKVCQHLKTAIEVEQKQSSVDTGAFAHLQGESAVGKLIATLSAKTDTAKIEALAMLKPEEIELRETLEKSLKENNPKEKAGLLRLRARRVATIAKTTAEKGAAVGPEAIAKLKTLANDFRTAQDVAALAAKNFKEGENLLPGTGGDAWRELFDAARKFALEAHPDRQFPALGADAECPLCQQPLAAGAERLLRFEAFIQAEAEKTVLARRQALVAEYRPFDALIMALNIDEATQAEIQEIDPNLVADSKVYEAALKSRHEAIKAAIVSHDWGGLDQPLVSPTLRFQLLAEKLNTEVEALEKAADEAARTALQSQLDELDARVKLSQVKNAVITAVAKLVHQGKLKKCLTAVRTNAISNKASELAEKVVSKDLADALNREFKSLGVGNLKVSLQSRANRGKALHKLKLELPQARSPGEILSEGEQRAIAIGSFLAEVGLSGGTGGIVFDDPVSSLDHRRRERVAKRLAAEAAQRQVIIFTHDIYFLCLLAEEAKQAGAPVVTQSLTRRTEGYGIADPELPFEGKNASKRIGALKAQQQVIAKLYREGNEQEHHRQTVDAYFRLRMAWERAVEEVLLREVILRFRKGVETQRLAGVSVNDDDYAQVNSGMSKCSNYAHDKAMMGGVAVPDPDELLVDILALENWRTLVHKRSEDTAKKRKTGPAVTAGAAPA
ncbi:AAA domain-containing protein [Halopseudomonas litoralis]|uniref:AAA domain-containing protein n=1 Tax=Halopseudomonas litoralis TaxID=797277 RepID=A0A1H1Q4H9_9GAMM|nr:AAA family ATPase [Halopseudomonas litoralis]SDS18274.1 AAA domain-containing protein [Halopseudomonas litoralis]